MDSLLHTLRIHTRRFAGVLAFVFTLGSLLAMAPAHANNMAPDHDHAMMHMHGTMHHNDHAVPSTPMPHHHGNNACCLGAMNCAQACDHSLIAFGAITGISGTFISPLSHHSAVAVTRPIQPPRRPPKA